MLNRLKAPLLKWSEMWSHSPKSKFQTFELYRTRSSYIICGLILQIKNSFVIKTWLTVGSLRTTINTHRGHGKTWEHSLLLYKIWKFLLHSCHVTITRWQPGTSYLELFMSSELCISVATLLTAKWICVIWVINRQNKNTITDVKLIIVYLVGHKIVIQLCAINIKLFYYIYFQIIHALLRH